MTENEQVGDQYGLSTPNVPEGHQATLRPVEGSDVPQVSVEPVPANPEPDASEPTTQAGLDAHAAQQAEAARAFADEHQRQLAEREAAEAEVAAAGESANIGSDGKAHFLRMVPNEVDPTTQEAISYHEVCGSDGEQWPCPQAQELEKQAAEARGERPQQLEQPAPEAEQAEAAGRAD
jgi:hypothetical protein